MQTELMGIIVFLVVLVTSNCSHRTCALKVSSCSFPDLFVALIVILPELNCQVYQDEAIKSCVSRLSHCSARNRKANATGDNELPR